MMQYTDLHWGLKALLSDTDSSIAELNAVIKRSAKWTKFKLDPNVHNRLAEKTKEREYLLDFIQQLGTGTKKITE